MSLELRIAKAKELIAKREEIDAELAALLGVEKKPVRCSLCQGEGHTARNCPTKQQHAADEKASE